MAGEIGGVGGGQGPGLDFNPLHQISDRTPPWAAAQALVADIAARAGIDPATGRSTNPVGLGHREPRAIGEALRALSALARSNPRAVAAALQGAPGVARLLSQAMPMGQGGDPG